MILTDTQLTQFHNDGFIILRSFVDGDRCKSILSVAKMHLDKQIEPIETEIAYEESSKTYRTTVSDYNSNTMDNNVRVRRLRQVYDRDILFKEWMEDIEIRPILQQILADEVTLTTAHHNSIMTKMPYTSVTTNWHQDRRYWSYEGDNLVSVWLALDTENSENGVLEFIPGSHKINFDAKHFDEKEYFSDTYPHNIKFIEQKTSTTLYEGDVIIFHSLLLHKANKNTTRKTKFSFVYTVKGSNTLVIKGTRSDAYPEYKLKEIPK